MDRDAWQDTVHRVKRSWKQLKQLSTHLASTHAQSLHCVQLFATLWIAAYQAALFMGFSQQEYCSGLPFPSPDFNITAHLVQKLNLICIEIL